MASENGMTDLTGYYEYVRREGRLPTLRHARRWSDGVLKTLGTTLDGGAKRALARVLPPELASSLKGVFWLLHFRNPNMSSQEFQQRAGRRSGNTNAEFARIPIMAVFSGIKRYVNKELDEKLVQALPPEIRALWQEALWQEAQPEKVTG
ncbi:MAG: DUF2267 domain-containing protein [Chloroflexi bacterium]|nr:DUF2267 domain-containing protein [Chloroflexota bacterium]MCI0580325.1 DUF2267 domain-containing protein [Chloroflexota bacterium]MCI0648528.1 DUF2267 domain-containing protein [Chloroflexota bacterium]MCI0728492.1 DUF2267 domain-containing protein [Chloroflexota bacterium]